MEKKEKELLNEIQASGEIPSHVAIIMDGNGRWAKGKGLPRIAGHREGINSVREIVEAAAEAGVKFLTLYTFSKENWKRPKHEVSALMRLLMKTIKKELERLMKNDIRLSVIGNLSDLPEKARKEMEDAIKETKNNKGLNLNLALSYSSRLEILSAVKKIAEKIKSNNFNIDEIDEKSFSRFLFTSNIPDPDLLIRTSGELRISNFLLWQLAYTEIYFTGVFWPDFRRLEFYNALREYQSRERRFGKVSEQVKSVK